MNFVPLVTDVCSIFLFDQGFGILTVKSFQGQKNQFQHGCFMAIIVFLYNFGIVSLKKSIYPH